jgi:hypothetical protein
LTMMIVGLTAIWAAIWHVPVQGREIPLRHPDAGEDLRTCTRCHRDRGNFPFQRFEHSASFDRQHRFAALNSQPVCQMCHRPGFCSDCHGVGVEIKPSIKQHADPRRSAPHRGNYLTRHRIDGRLNPMQCFRCHGSPKTSVSCRQCHG